MSTLAAGSQLGSSSITLYIALVTFLVAGVGFLFGAVKTNINRRTLASLKDSVDAYEASDKVLRSKVDDLTRQNHEKDALIAKLQGRIDELSDMVTGASAIKALSEQLRVASADNAARIERALAQTARNYERIDEVLELSGEMRREVRKLAETASKAGPQPQPRRRPPPARTT